MSQKPTSNKGLSTQTSRSQVSEEEALQAELLRQMSPADRKSAENLLREMQEEISPEATPLWQFVNDNAPKIAAVVITLVLVIGGFAFYHGYQESALESGRIELATIISNSNDAERLKALEAFKVSAPSELTVGIEYEMARAAIFSGDEKKAEECFLAIVQKEGNNALGLTASINLAGIYLETNNPEKALSIYESFINTVPANLRTSLYVDMADIAVIANQKDKAIKAYENAIDLMLKASQLDNTEHYIDYYKKRIQQLS